MELMQLLTSLPGVANSTEADALRETLLQGVRENLLSIVEKGEGLEALAAQVILASEPTSRELEGIIFHLPEFRQEAWDLLQNTPAEDGWALLFVEDGDEMVCRSQADFQLIEEIRAAASGALSIN